MGNIRKRIKNQMPFLMDALFVALVSSVGAFIQRVSGFGFGIFVMIFFPHILTTYGQANALSGMLSLISCTAVALTVFKYIKWNQLLFPIVASTCVTVPVVTFLLKQDDSLLILLLGIALVAMSVYFFFFSSKIRIRPTWYAGLTAGGLSGVLGGLFGMGGPPVVVYFMQTSNGDNMQYLATIQAYFVLSNAVGSVTKALNGHVTSDVLSLLAFGALGLVAGNLIGKLVFDRLNAAVLRKIVYGFMAMSGVINIASAIISIIN